MADLVELGLLSGTVHRLLAYVIALLEQLEQALACAAPLCNPWRMTERILPPKRLTPPSVALEWRGRTNLRRCVGGGPVSGIALPLGGVLILLASTIAAIAEPLPVRKVGSCPAGYVGSADWCKPMRGTRHDAIVKVRNCPANWTENGNYCLSPLPWRLGN